MALRTIPREQLIMGSLFTSMGLATMLLPDLVYKHSFRRSFTGSDEMTPAMKLVLQCFGSQASLCGLLILVAEFKSRTYRYFGLAMVPYFIFDLYFWRKGALTMMGALGDGVGNLVFSVCCYIGFKNSSS